MEDKMKYSELISFSPIESTIQLKESNRTKAESANLVKNYVMFPQNGTHSLRLYHKKIKKSSVFVIFL